MASCPWQNKQAPFYLFWARYRNQAKSLSRPEVALGPQANQEGSVRAMCTSAPSFLKRTSYERLARLLLTKRGEKAVRCTKRLTSGQYLPCNCHASLALTGQKGTQCSSDRVPCRATAQKTNTGEGTVDHAYRIPQNLLRRLGKSEAMYPPSIGHLQCYSRVQKFKEEPERTQRDPCIDTRSPEKAQSVLDAQNVALLEQDCKTTNAQASEPIRAGDSDPHSRVPPLEPKPKSLKTWWCFPLSAS